MRSRCLISAVLVVVWASVSYAVTYPFGIRNDIIGTQGKNIQSMAIRSDGRYLFHHASSSADLYVLDLQDFAKDVRVATLSNPIVSVILLDDQRLAVVTTATVQYFNVSKPFDVTEESSHFTQAASSTTTPAEACSDGSGQIYILETATGTGLDIVRKIKGVVSVETYAWSNLFSGTSDFHPVSLQCLDSTFFVLARKTGTRDVSGVSTSYESELRIGRPGAASTSISFDSLNYSRRDFVLSPSKDQFLILFERNTSQSTSSDSIVDVLSTSSFASLTSKSVGSDTKAITTFLSGTAPFYGFFVGLDKLLGASGASNVFLLSSQSELPSTTFGIASDRGTGSSDVGSSIPTLTAYSKSDHYKILRSKATGLSLMSSAPSFSFVGDPSDITLSASSPIQFTLTSEADMAVQVRYNDSESTEPGTNGIQTTPGVLIQESTLAKNVSSSFSVSLSQLNITKKGDHSLLIVGHEESSSSAPYVRLGVRFSYNPPPDQITDLALAFGDQSVRVSFSVPSGGNIKTLRLYLAQNETDAGSITGSRSITLADGSTLSSPLDIAIANWKGSRILAPLPNEQTLYVAVVAIDTSDQFGTISSTSQITPRATLTLAQAFGSTASCSLQVASKNERRLSDPLQGFCGLFLFLLILGYLRKKLGPAHLRNRRGGD